MKNPIGKFKREKLEEIKNLIDSFILEFNLVKENLVLLDTIQNDLSTFKEDFEQIKEVLFYEPTPEEVQEQEKEAGEQIENMKLIVRSAITDMLNDETNQKALQEFVGQFIGGIQGAQAGQDVFGMGWDQLTNQDGELDWIKALFALLNQRSKGGSPSPATSVSRGAYG